MKNRKLYRTLLASVAMASMLTGCGGGGGGGSEFSSADGNVNIEASSTQMTIGRAYTVHEGDTIVKNAENTVVVIETDLETGETVAVLQSGSATIERE